MNENMRAQDEISLAELFKALLRKIKVLVLALLIGVIVGASLGVVQTINVKYYGTKIDFYVNPKKDSTTTTENNSQYGVYGAYGLHVMDNMVTLLNSELFAERLTLNADGLPLDKNGNLLVNNASLQQLVDQAQAAKAAATTAQEKVEAAEAAIEPMQEALTLASQELTKAESAKSILEEDLTLAEARRTYLETKLTTLWERAGGQGGFGVSESLPTGAMTLEIKEQYDALYLEWVQLNYSPIAIETLIGKGARQLTMSMVSVERVAEYAAEDADVTLRLKHELWREVERLGLVELYRRIEEPMIDVLADMELTGVRIDSEALARYAVELRAMLQQLEADVRSMADEPELNINSSRQLGEVLFAKLRIAEKPKMTKTKQFSTEEEYLQGFAHNFPIVGKILEYRGVKKLLSTYVEALPELVNPKTGHIHTSYNQAVTATGRLSSANPNLQNIPIRDAMGKPIRQAFIASDEEHTLISADYSQIELRIMAHLSGDKALIEAFHAGDDIHAATAARLYGKTPAEVTSDERRMAKTANFGIIYGISAFGLAQRLDIANREARDLIESYFASYPDVKRYMDDAIAHAAEKGYVETMFGRRRQLHDITSSNRTVRGLAERNAINAPIQGSAADIMKLAMAEIARRFRAEGIRSKMILQVHDEVVIDTLLSEVDLVKHIVKEAMEGVAELRVPLVVDINSGDDWLAAH